MSTQKQMCKYTVYIDEDTGQLYIETDDQFYEVEIGANVTEEINMTVSNLEMLRAYEPEYTEIEEETGFLSIFNDR